MGRCPIFAAVAGFFSELLVKEAERNGFGGLLFADFPDVDLTTPEGELSIHQMAAFAQFEARRISQRTKVGLAVAKSRGVKLGGARGGQRAANEARQQQAVEFAERLRGILLQWQPVVHPCLPWLPLWRLLG
jgi:DNA invertase Pin-like site-specific DNA recombinase